MLALRLILAFLLAALFPACGILAAKSKTPDVTRAQTLTKMDPTRIQADTMGFADRFVTAMTGVYDEVERRAPTPSAKDAAHQLKTELALGAIGSAVNPRPIAGMMDLVVLVSLLRQIAEDPWATQTFGPDAPRLVAALQRQEADVHAMARQYLTDDQLAELQQLTQHWHQTHPDNRFVSRIHLADLPEANLPPAELGKLPSSIFGLLFFDPTANLDPAIREITLSRATSERMFFYLQRLPLLLQLQGKDFYRQLFDTPEFKRVLADVSAATDSTTRFAQTSSQFTDVLERFPQQLSEERQQALTQAASELAEQRDAAIRQLSTTVATQRQEAVTQMADALRHEQQSFVTNLQAATDHSIDRLLTRLAILGVLLIAFGATLAYLYRRILARSAKIPHGSSGP
jgi:hypothetical protein